MKVASSGDVGFVSVLNRGGRGRDSIVFSCMWPGSASTNLSRAKRRKAIQGGMREVLVVLVKGPRLLVAFGLIWPDVN